MQFPHHDGACLPQFSHGGCIADAFGELANARLSTLDIQLIFDGDRNAVQRPAPIAARDFRLRDPRFFHGAVRHQIDVGVKFSVDGLNAIKNRTSELYGRQLTPLDQLLSFVN